MKMKNFVAALTITAMAVGMLPAQAKVGSVSSSSRSSSISLSKPSSSSYSRPYSAPSSSSSSGRVGSGGSSGVTRANVMAQVRQPSAPVTVRNYGNVNTATQTVPTRSYAGGGNNGGNYNGRNNGGYNNGGYNNGGYNNGGYNNQPNRPGYSGATVAGAAIAGAAVGALANSALHNDHPVVVNGGGYAQAPVVVNGGGYAQPAPVVVDNNGYANNGYVAGGAPVVAAAPVVYAGHSGFGFGSFLLVLLLLGAAYFVYRMMKGNNNVTGHSNFIDGFGSSNEQDEEDAEMQQDLAHAKDLLNSAPAFFKRLQDANNRAAKSELASMMTAAYYHELFKDIDSRTVPSQTTVIALDVVGNEVLGFERRENCYVGSIHFRGVVNEGPGQQDDGLDEVWNFTKDLVNGPWKLEGIQQA